VERCTTQLHRWWKTFQLEIGADREDREENGGGQEFGRAYVHLVDGSLQYSSRPVAHVHEMEVFGPEGQPSYFQVSGFHRAEVEAANTLAMMRQCGDPVLGFVVPRRRRSRMLRRQPRIPNSFQVLGRYIGIHHGLNNVTQKPNQERCNC
jgi:hypothetical protein